MFRTFYATSNTSPSSIRKENLKTLTWYNLKTLDFEDQRMRHKDKVKGIRQSGRVENAQRKTTEAVLDDPTRVVLTRLMNNTENPKGWLEPKT